MLNSQIIVKEKDAEFSITLQNYFARTALFRVTLHRFARI